MTYDETQKNVHDIVDRAFRTRNSVNVATEGLMSLFPEVFEEFIGEDEEMHIEGAWNSAPERNDLRQELRDIVKAWKGK